MIIVRVKPNSFSSETFTNVGISPQDFLTFSFTFFLKLSNQEHLSKPYKLSGQNFIRLRL